MAAEDPTGEDLCVGTTNGNSLPGPYPEEPEEREITFGSPVELTEGVRYAIVVRALGADYSNLAAWQMKNVADYSDGNAYYSNDDGSSWTNRGVPDQWFQTKANENIKDNYTFELLNGTSGCVLFGSSWGAQTFIATSTYTITSVILGLWRTTGAVPGIITVSIRATEIPTHDFMFELRDENGVLRESYNAGDNDYVKQYGSEEVAQTFTTDDSYYFRKIKLLLYKIGNPVGANSVGLLTVDADGHPDQYLASISGGPLASLGTDPAGTWVEITFSMSSYTLLAAHTKYAIRVAGGDDVNNCICWRVDSTNATYLKGAREHSTDNAVTWITYANTPTKPTNPSPGDPSSDITLDESPLSWNASTPVVADTYEIYFREQGESWVKIGVAQAGVSYVLNFGYIDYEKTYEWRIDAANDTGITTGTIWEFSSIVFAPPLPGASGGAGGGGGGGGEGEESSPTGENNMITLRRLVVAVENKIFYEDI